MANLKTLASWLRDAHAMEKATCDNLSRLIDHHKKDYPQLAERLRQHHEESERHVTRVEECLKKVDAKPSVVKEAATRFAGMAQAFATGFTPDEPVKNSLAALAFENFEIASYLSLAAAAESCGQPEIKRLCEQNLEDERNMAQWLETHIPEITRQYLSR